MKKVGLALLTLLVLAGLWLFAAASGWLGSPEAPGEIHAEARPAATNQERAALQAGPARLLGAPPAKQILFGDFHVHTTFSFDAFLINMPIAGGPGTHPPADACDFARFCSALDFWSINDHAVGITPRAWRDTIDSIRQCNDVAGDPANPDTLIVYSNAANGTLLDMNGFVDMYATASGDKTWHDSLSPQTTPSGAVTDRNRESCVRLDPPVR